MAFKVEFYYKMEQFIQLDRPMNPVDWVILTFLYQQGLLSPEQYMVLCPMYRLTHCGFAHYGAGNWGNQL